MRIYNDPFERMLAQVVCDCAEEMNKLQPQDLTFIPDVVYLLRKDAEGYLEHDDQTQCRKEEGI